MKPVYGLQNHQEHHLKLPQKDSPEMAVGQPLTKTAIGWSGSHPRRGYQIGWLDPNRQISPHPHCTSPSCCASLLCAFPSPSRSGLQVVLRVEPETMSMQVQWLQHQVYSKPWRKVSSDPWSQELHVSLPAHLPAIFALFSFLLGVNWKNNDTVMNSSRHSGPLTASWRSQSI